ncbi:MAG: hypothetical protein JW811_10335 [Clostridiales bacterium]|nr:hypothetical protein [Clostridiales bacterium]
MRRKRLYTAAAQRPEIIRAPFEQVGYPDRIGECTGRITALPISAVPSA